MKNLILLLVFVATVAAAYLYGVPAWSTFLDARSQLAEVDALKERVSAITDARNKLLDRYTSVTQEELDRLDTMLPTSLTPEELYVLFEKIIRDSGVAVDDITVSVIAKNENGGDAMIPFTLRVIGPYTNLRALFDNLENNLRLMDIMGIEVVKVEAGGAIFTLTIKGNMYYGG